MTAGPLFSHAAAEDHPATAPTREDLIERERQRRLALIAARASEAPTAVGRPHADTGPKTPGQAEDALVRESASLVSRSPEAPVPDGFESESAWIAAQQAARAVAVAARDAGCPAPRLESLASDTTADQLAKDLVAAVLPMPPLTAVQSLVGARSSLERLLPPHIAVRARALVEGGLDHTLPGYGSTPEDGSGGTWQLYTDHMRLAGYARVPVENQQRLMDSLPLPVVDDLIDDGHVSASAVRDDSDRRLYLQARLTPSRVDMEGLRELGWTDEQARREFRFRLACGDIAVLDEAHALTDEQRRMAAALVQVRSTGRIPSDLSAQKWLWPALERLAPQAPVNLRRDKAFGSWYVVRRMHRSLRAAHRAELSKDSKRADSLFNHARNDANALREVWTAGGWEAKNLIAYLLVLNSSKDEAYEQALEMISPVGLGGGLREDQLPGGGRVNLEHNREVLRQLQRHREGDHVLNPYLVLDAPDGAPTELWKGKWRTLRRALDEDGEAMVNEAKDAIQVRERGRALVEPFILPLMPQKWANPAVDAAPTGVGAPSMPRRTAPPTRQEQDYARDRAAWGIVRAACQNVGLPAEAENYPPLPPESSDQ